jgi:hypothetical protein
MVGAGFSRNADPLHEDVGGITAWGNLIKRLQRRLNRGCGDGSESGESEPCVGDFAEIAEEFEQVFGRTELRSAIQRSVPDEDYEPSVLHEMLMGLPWTDVFTTNYDRLLERTRSEVPNRSYSVVRSAAQLPKSSQPRIVKLHGDFDLPNEPLVITREDYRTYPKERVAFVNTVRQSLMENSFVLVGFSGDDPNFKNWIGWLRDVLAERRHTTYLCGLHSSLSPGKQKVLLRDGIQPVDLSSVFSDDRDASYESTLKWLFCSLYAGQPPSGRYWPKPIDRESQWAGCSEVDPLASDRALKEEQSEPQAQPPF